ncbi:unnamed protein product [Phaedon cochleariae]|uniref:DUF4371 domain-containing protein n=1 Tax=Phaedon cochleariae TaxID=80249 RepID=A0A9P0GI91_PHACE|nr:unnamed protein product [Phaedon cochleariae]
MKNRGQVEARIDSKLYEQLEDERKYWRNVLLRIVVAVKSLATRGLPFRGKTDKFGSTNNGNFMMVLEAISEFDPFLAKHIQKFGNPGKGNTSYLSFATYEKIIKIMAAKVTTTIMEQLRKAKYFSFSVDSTPDIIHVDQLSLILRFVQDNAEPVERFVCFLPNTGHKAEDMLLAVMETFKSLDIDINNCRGQSYDNASNMSGQYNGLQAKIKEKCQYATYVPCAAHSLNLIGSSAAESSTERTKLLKSFLTKPENVTVKSSSQTRWSARDDACTSLNNDWSQIIAALEAIRSDSAYHKALVKNEAAGLLAQLNSLETAILSEFWGSVLKRFGIVSKILQGVDTDVEVVSRLYKSLITFVEEQRESFDTFEKAGKRKCTDEYRNIHNRIVKRKKRDDESSEGEVVFQGRDHFRVNTFFPICDRLLGELRKRKTSYEAVTANFAFLCKLDTMSASEVRLNAIKLQKVYPIDLADDLQEECVLLKQFLTSKENKMSLRQLSLFIKQKDLKEAFPYIEIALRIFLCTAVTNCSAERHSLPSVTLSSDESETDEGNKDNEHQSNDASATITVDGNVVDIDNDDVTNTPDENTPDTTLGNNSQTKESQITKTNVKRKGELKQGTTDSTTPTASSMLMSFLLEEKKKSTPIAAQDQLYTFFISISVTVKKFSPYHQAIAKQKMLSLVSRMELEQLVPPSQTAFVPITTPFTSVTGSGAWRSQQYSQGASTPMPTPQDWDYQDL